MLRVLLLTMFAVLTVYTAVVISRHGWNLLSIFFGDMATMAWPGQFNLDFMFMLMLSGLWVAWRHRFSPAGLVLAVGAVFGGALFLSTYVLVVSMRAKGDTREMLLGEHAGDA